MYKFSTRLKNTIRFLVLLSLLPLPLYGQDSDDEEEAELTVLQDEQSQANSPPYIPGSPHDIQALALEAMESVPIGKRREITNKLKTIKGIFTDANVNHQRLTLDDIALIEAYSTLMLTKNEYWLKNTPRIITGLVNSCTTEQGLERLHLLWEAIAMVPQIQDVLALLSKSYIQNEGITNLLNTLHHSYRQNRHHDAIHLITYFGIQDHACLEILGYLTAQENEAIGSFVADLSHPSPLLENYARARKNWNKLLPIEKFIPSPPEEREAIIQSELDVLNALDALADCLGLPPFMEETPAEDQERRHVIGHRLINSTDAEAIRTFTQRLEPLQERLAIWRSQIPLEHQNMALMELFGLSDAHDVSAHMDLQIETFQQNPSASVTPPSSLANSEDTSHQGEETSDSTEPVSRRSSHESLSTGMYNPLADQNPRTPGHVLENADEAEQAGEASGFAEPESGEDLQTLRVMEEFNSLSRNKNFGATFDSVFAVAGELAMGEFLSRLQQSNVPSKDIVESVEILHDFMEKHLLHDILLIFSFCEASGTEMVDHLRKWTQLSRNIAYPLEDYIQRFARLIEAPDGALTQLKEACDRWRFNFPLASLMELPQGHQLRSIQDTYKSLQCLDLLKKVLYPEQPPLGRREIRMLYSYYPTNLDTLEQVGRFIALIEPLTNLIERWNETVHITYRNNLLPHLLTMTSTQEIHEAITEQMRQEQLQINLDFEEDDLAGAGQEGMRTELMEIISHYQALKQDPTIHTLIEERMPPRESMQTAFHQTYEALKNRLQSLQAHPSNASLQFRIEKALLALELLAGNPDVQGHPIPHYANYVDFHVEGLPHIRQLFVFLYQLLPQQTPELFVKNYLSAHFLTPKNWVAFQKSARTKSDVIQRFAAHGNIGEALGADEAQGNRALNMFLADFNVLQNGEGSVQALPLNLCQKMLMAYYEKEKNDLMSTIEALFMTMRGHIASDQSLLDPAVADAPACALGVYVNLLKAVVSLENMGQSDLFNVEITNCGVPTSLLPSADQDRATQRQADRARRQSHRQSQAQAAHTPTPSTGQQALARQVSETPTLDEEENEPQELGRQRSSP